LSTFDTFGARKVILKNLNRHFIIMNNNNPIGIFDSGVGGLSIWKEIHQLLPNEHTIYLADSKNAPYGEKSKQQIIELCIKNTEWLLAKGCKLIVVACNTATTNAIHYLRQNYEVPFIGIEPAIKPAALQTQTKKIGILATKGTLSSALFNSTTDLYGADIEIIEQVGTGLVTLIESGKLNSTATVSLLRQYLQPMITANIDYLVLGCTHYPFLIPQIQSILPKHIKIIDSGEAVAKQTHRILETYHLFRNSKETSVAQFYNNLTTNAMQKIVGKAFEVQLLNF